jgi:hypothetical protein
LGKNSLLQLPFLWYGKMFLRITHAVSRRQEFVADELAARTVGSKPLIDGLRNVHGAGRAFPAYWVNECAPVLSAGFRPPLAEGFHRFVESDPVASSIHKELEEEMKSEQGDPYDTHPPLKERIAAIEALPPGQIEVDDPPASDLLANLPELEVQLLATMADPDKTAKLQSIDWAEVAAQVYLPQWKSLTKSNAKPLQGVTPESLPALAKDLKKFGSTLKTPDGSVPDEEQAAGFANFVVGAALSVLLVTRGGKADSEPGLPLTVRVGQKTVETFAILQQLADGKLTEATWLSEIHDLGITGADLGEAVGNE